MGSLAALPKETVAHIQSAGCKAQKKVWSHCDCIRRRPDFFFCLFYWNDYDCSEVCESERLRVWDSTESRPAPQDLTRPKASQPAPGHLSRIWWQAC
jgi:hypothetical protein